MCWTDEALIHHVHVTLLAPDFAETPTLNDLIGLSHLRQQVSPLTAPCILTIGPEDLIIRIIEGVCYQEFSLRIRPFDSLAQACHVIRLAVLHEDEDHTP